MQKPDNLELFGSRSNPNLSIVIPTYNESENIIDLLKSIKENIGDTISAEIIVVDDNSPDGTGKLVDDYIAFLNRYEVSASVDGKEKEKKGFTQIRTIHRKQKEDLIQAVLHGIKSSYGEHILIMDADFSHPPETIPKIIEKLQSNEKCIIIASRYIKGSSIEGWKLKRRLISSSANSIARLSLGIRNIKDPMSGFFAFHKSSIENIQFTTKGYKILLELLVKSNKAKVIEIPYVFTDRKIGKSKMNYKTAINYLNSIWKLYRYGNKSSSQNESNSIKFISKTGRFFTVGASGLLVNYLISMFLSNSIHTKLWYMESTFIGIMVSITSNFILNKLWTFEDRDFSFKHFIKQYLSFILICSLGASLQLSLVYVLMEFKLPYALSLLFAVMGASISNFLLNKKVTFKEKLWG